MVSISFERVEVNKNDTYLLHKGNNYRLLYFYQMALPAEDLSELRGSCCVEMCAAFLTRT